MTNTTANGVYAIVLAAGSALRFGSSKQLAELGGITLVRHATEIAHEVCALRNVLVLGHDWNAIYDACSPLSGFLIINNRHAAGMGSSISIAVRSIRHVASAVTIVLADQPLITSAHIAALIDEWSGDDKEIVATAYAGAAGAPTLLPRGCFDALIALEGDHGARALFNDERFTVKTVPFPDAAIDVDTIEDLASLSRSARS